ncbi:Hypothetical protein POVN_LOCUS502 [uncultured virus]|nr:Hypothetical protein POVN_LOCUS502 [uncultured virus]
MATRVRAKAIKQGKIATDRFSTKRNLDIDAAAVKKMHEDCKPREMKDRTQPLICTPPVKAGAPPTVKVRDDGTNTPVSITLAATPLPLPGQPPLAEGTSHPEIKGELPPLPEIKGELPPKDAARADLTAPTPPPEVKAAPAAEESDEERRRPFTGEGGELIWGPNAILPEELADIVSQQKAIFNIRDEAKGFAVTVYPPRDAAKGKEVTVKRVPRAPMGVATRVVVSVGGKENFVMAAGAGGKATGNTFCNDGDAFMVPIGVAAAVEIQFDNATTFKAEPRPGWRVMTHKKQPERTYVIVIDGIVNSELLVRKIKEEAEKLSNGNEVVQKHLEDKLGSALDLSPEDTIALRARNMTTKTDTGTGAARAAQTEPGLPLPEEETPLLVPLAAEVSDIDAVAAKAAAAPASAAPKVASTLVEGLDKAQPVSREPTWGQQRGDKTAFHPREKPLTGKERRARKKKAEKAKAEREATKPTVEAAGLPLPVEAVPFGDVPLNALTPAQRERALAALPAMAKVETVPPLA